MRAHPAVKRVLSAAQTVAARVVVRAALAVYPRQQRVRVPRPRQDRFLQAQAVAAVVAVLMVRLTMQELPAQEARQR